jgi:O-antigen ligase/Tfp pilus assembly protein PilF
MALVEIGWLTLAILVPLWINLWADQPFELSKVLLLRSVTWLLAGLWLADRVRRRDTPWPELPHYPLLVPAGLLSTTLLLSTVLGTHPPTSLWGSYTRAQGLLTHLSYVLLFLIVTTELRTTDQATRLASALAFTAAPIALLGVLQATGVDPLGLVTDGRSPIYATLGRSNFVGAYLAMLLPLTIALALGAQPGHERVLLILLAAGEGAIIIGTRAWAASLAAATSLAIFGLLWWLPRLAERTRMTTVAAAISSVIIGLGTLAYALLRAEGGSWAARRTIWVAAWELIRERPVLGYGIDALEIVFPRVYPPQLVYYHGRDVFVDRAHNLLLDWALAAGLAGMAAFLLIVGLFFRVGLRRIATSQPRTKRHILLIACLAAVAGNLAGNLVSFDVAATSTTTWLLMALVSSPAMATERELHARPAIVIERRETRWLRFLAAGLLVAGAAAAAVQLNMRPLLASIAHRTAVRYAALGDVDAATVAAQQAVDCWPWEPAHHWLLGHYALIQGGWASADADTLARAEAAFLTARELRPLDHNGWAALADFYGTAAAWRDPAEFSRSHEAYRQAVALAPHRARLYVAWGEISLAEGRPVVALHRFRQAVDLDATDGVAFRLIGDVELALGRPQAALEAYQDAVYWSPDAWQAHLGLARAHAALGQSVAARSALERALALDPHHPAIHSMWEVINE